MNIAQTWQWYSRYETKTEDWQTKNKSRLINKSLCLRFTTYGGVRFSSWTQLWSVSHNLQPFSSNKHCLTTNTQHFSTDQQQLNIFVQHPEQYPWIEIHLFLLAVNEIWFLLELFWKLLWPRMGPELHPLTKKLFLYCIIYSSRRVSSF